MRFHNQLAVVTGAAQGIGAAVVQQLLAQGARVALLDRNEQQLRDFYQTLNSDVCSMYVVDVADAQAVERCIEQVENTQGVIGLLANVPDKDKYEVPPFTISNDLIGVGIPKGEQGLTDVVNQTLTELEAKGQAQKIYDTWFGPNTKTPLTRLYKIGDKS